MPTRSPRKAATRRDHRWLKPADWSWAQMNLPICCIDILPFRRSLGASSKIDSIGLITRTTEKGVLGFCLIGGRLLYGESLASGIKRQITETLGNQVQVKLSQEPFPAFVAQYSPSGKRPFCLDPRQHAIGLTYVIELAGVPKPCGETTAFNWFSIDKLPHPKQFGFNQDRVIKKCLEILREREAPLQQ